jgi:Barstar (barnase inhibitor)
MTALALSPLRPEQSGVFLVPQALPTLRTAARRAGCAWLEVDLHNARDKAAFLLACARQLEFPSHFGHNWDAFSDCMNDVSWQAAPGCVIVFANVDFLERHAPDVLATALEILRTAAAERRSHNATFVVLLDHAPAALAVEPFPEPRLT